MPRVGSGRRKRVAGRNPAVPAEDTVGVIVPQIREGEENAMLRWGVIGAGGIADRRTIPEGIMPSERAQLTALLDVDADRTRAVGHKYGVGINRCFTSLRQFLDAPEVDAVYIATPVHLHKDQAVAAAHAGKHILCEKPLCLTLRDCDDVIAACREHGVTLMVGYMMRFHALHQRLKKMIDTGALGQVVAGRAQLTCWYPEIAGAWRQDPRQGGGGSLMDMGSHGIDLLRWLIGEVDQVSAFADTVTFDYLVEDVSTVMLKHGAGAQSVVDNMFNVPDAAAQNALEIYGTQGAVIADHTIGQDPGGKMTAYLTGAAGGYEAAQVRAEEGSGRPVVAPAVNMYRAQIDHFAACVEEGAIPSTTGEEAKRVLEITLAAYDSARSGRVVDVSA
jgi:predicted dehydrogenase